mmetsp:Transcript_11699/g.25257  ORF Transcript_11699/g.25257 Transcript_11699/m.25257 type:complete len:145 (+) Transcript_11699:1046-1480(+)
MPKRTFPEVTRLCIRSSFQWRLDVFHHCQFSRAAWRACKHTVRNMNNKGSTKTVEARHWAKFVRLVNWNYVGDYNYDCATIMLSDDEYENGDDNDTVPSRKEEPKRRSEENTPMPSISGGAVFKLETGVPKLWRRNTGQVSFYC